MDLPLVYSIDYTLIAECESRLFDVQTCLNNDDVISAAEIVLECRSLLQRMLNSDLLLVPDDDVESGFVKETDMNEYIKAMAKMVSRR